MQYSVTSPAMSTPQVVLQSFKKQPSLDAYMQEWRTIREARVTTTVGHHWPGYGEDEQSDFEESVGGIDTDPDAIWLENAGFGNIVTQLKGGNGIEEGGDILLQTSVMPRKHEAVVRKRMNTLRSTIKRQRDGEKKSTGSRSDVRNIFNSSKPQISPTKSTVVTTVIRNRTSPLSSNSPRVSPSPHSSPRTSPRGSPTPARHLSSSPAHSTGVSTHSSLTTTTTTSITRHASTPAPSGQVIGRQTNSSNLFRGSNSVTERDRVRTRVHSSHSHHQSSDSGIVSRDSNSSNEYVHDGHLGTGSPEPMGPNRGSSDGSQSDNDYSHRPSPPGELRVPNLSPGSSTGSPTQEDIKLDFETPTPQFPLANGTQELPDFMVMPDALGITHISDLSPGDMDKVRSVALVELTITFEDHNIPLRPRRPAKLKSIPENRVFGVQLKDLLQADQQRIPGTQIPLLFDAMITHLETHCLDDEGILRVPGSSARLQSQKQEIDSKFNQGEFSFEGLKSSDVCSMLKMFIRELPIPVLTKEYLSAFASIPDIGDLKEQVRTLNLLVLLLPSVHQIVLKRLLIFLERVGEHSSSNKMDMINVSMVIAPNLFMSLPARHNLDDVTMASKTSQVVRLLIKYHRLLWTVPGEMLRQIRYLYEIEMKKFNTRAVTKALKQMQNQLIKGYSQSQIPETQSGPHIVKVKAPLYTRVCMAVDVTHGMTARDIVAKLQKRSRLNKDLIKRRVSGTNFSEAYFLQSQVRTASPVDELQVPESDQNEDVRLGEQFVFEVGGNIGERCLANDTDMCSLYKVNPNAQWVIKPRDCPDL